MASHIDHVQGLTDDEVLNSRQTHGANIIVEKKRSAALTALTDVVREPMFLMLVVAAAIYFITGQVSDGVFMLLATVLVSAISVYQESRSRNALESLKQLTRPFSKVIRNGEETEIKSEDIVIGDAMVLEEGVSVPADGELIAAHDFSVNESMLTGESLPVFKTHTGDGRQVYKGSGVESGSALCKVTGVGAGTRLGKIGESLIAIKEEDTPLQKQIRSFVKTMAFVGVLFFAVVWIINYLESRNIAGSLLKALSLAMSIVPEEIPVAFSTFMALGAWRLMKMGIVVKQTSTVETLGSATVICTDKTGTITENKMVLAKVFSCSTAQVSDVATADEAGKNVIRLAMWASEPRPFDPMEIALHDAYSRLYAIDERADYTMVHEYPLHGKPPMMTHVFGRRDGHRIVAAKGAPEALIKVSGLSGQMKAQILSAVEALSREGYRVLGVGQADISNDDYPEHQHQISFVFKGLVAFYDPPKRNISAVFESFYKAGISVKIITGDNAATTATIAGQVGFRDSGQAVNGADLLELSDDDLRRKAADTNIFTRMFPEAKLRIINALKANGEIVAMTGDGVNDGPALKAAHIGIAMGKKGTETAKQASSLVLADDDLGKMADAVAMGRKIYANLKKAIRYIISIHIPIILTVFIPLVRGWAYPNIFSPVHVIFFELIMAPTCSIIYENEPMEANLMLLPPRSLTATFFSLKELATSLLQGLGITVGVLLMYRYGIASGLGESATRTMVFVTLITANIFLTHVNRSFYYSLLTTIKYKNNLILMVVAVTVLLSAIMLFFAPAMLLFKLTALPARYYLYCVIVGCLSVIWFEVVKWDSRIRSRKK